MKLNRRQLLKQSSLLALVAPTSAWSQPTSAEPYGDPEAAEKWLSQYLQIPGASSGTFHLGRFADRMYFTTKEIAWKPNAGQKSLPSVVVPAGFVTDLASIPRIFWSLLPTDGAYTFPAVVHDYLYWTQTMSREDADLAFKYGMEDFKVNAPTVFSIYQTVRLRGGGPWNENAGLRKLGEKRRLCKYPDLPTITWPDWKKRPEVFC